MNTMKWKSIKTTCPEKNRIILYLSKESVLQAFKEECLPSHEDISTGLYIGKGLAEHWVDWPLDKVALWCYPPEGIKQALDTWKQDESLTHD